MITFADVQKQSSVLNSISRISSIIFHPVFVPALIYSFLLFFSSDFLFGIPTKTQHWWLVIISYITITFPLLVVFLLWRLKFIESMQMHGIKERLGPLIASMLFYFWTFWLFHKQFQAPLLLQSFLCGIFLTTVFLFIASIFFKVSLHSGAWGCVIVFAIICCFYQIHNGIILLMLSLLVGGIVGSARMRLNAHTFKQLYSGYLLGALAQLVAFLVCKTYL